MVGPLRPQFVLFGSSIVEFSFSDSGWGALLSDFYSRKADVILRGYAGRNSRRALQVLKSLSETTRVIFLTAPPINEEQMDNTLSSTFKAVRTNKSCQRYSEACLELCREMEIEGVDMWSTIQKIPNWKSICFTDGVHFAPEGSKIVAREILKVIGEANWEPSLHWKDMPTEFSEDSPYDPINPEETGTINLSKLIDIRRSNYFL